MNFGTLWNSKILRIIYSSRVYHWCSVINITEKYKLHVYCRSCSLCINEGTTLDIFLHQIGIKLPRWQLECNYGHFLCCVHCLRFHVHGKYCSVLQVPEVNIKNSVSFENLSSIWSTNDSGGCCCNVQLDTVEVRLTSIRPYKVAIRHHIFNVNLLLSTS